MPLWLAIILSCHPLPNSAVVSRQKIFPRAVRAWKIPESCSVPESYLALNVIYKLNISLFYSCGVQLRSLSFKSDTEQAVKRGSRLIIQARPESVGLSRQAMRVFFFCKFMTKVKNFNKLLKTGLTVNASRSFYPTTTMTYFSH